MKKILFLILLASANFCWAGTDEAYELQVPIFGYDKAQNLAEYIAKIYQYGLMILVPVLIVSIIISGVSWIMAAGDSGKITKAKSGLITSFIGLGIGLFSYVFLSLVGINVLKNPTVQKISPERGDILIINGEIYSMAEAMSKLPPERRGNVSEFDNAACPRSQTSFQVFFTNYYMPKYGESYGGNDFFCNVAMQCSCPKGKDPSRQCHYKNPYTPCAYFPADTAYCTHTASGNPPVANQTIAADASCFNYGCKFKISGNNNEYIIQDTGSWVHGTHMDLFVGYRDNLNQIAGVYTITLSNPSECFK
ncbi:MAG: 3D domain-containing protein [Candidatus Parcubacteria bacterium]|nr:3D domain-containing protein [Candidatus Parcubacteria bacterium]